MLIDGSRSNAMSNGALRDPGDANTRLTPLADNSPASMCAVIFPVVSIYMQSYTIIPTRPIPGTPYDRNLDFEFSQPFLYTGENLRVTMRSEYNQFANSSIMSNDGVCLVSKSDTYASYKNSPSTSSYVPVFIFGLDVSAPQVEGSVMRGDAPASGATVRFVSDDVLYTATTGEDGSFSVLIYQSSRDYEVTAMMSGALDSDVQS